MADTVLTELKIHDFDSLEQMSQHESEIGGNDLVFTPDMSAKLFLFKHAWADYLVSDMSWLRADTFSWHSGDKYKTAYNHLTNDMRTVYAWVDRAGSYGFNIYTESATPSVGDNIYDENGSVIGSCSSFNSGSLGWTGSDGTTYSAWLRSVGDDLPSARTETIGNITITYYLAQDGHKICLPDQESNIVALYESTGVAWYYILDTENKQFKLPRTKYGFTGLRDSVGGYVAPAVPNITAGFRTGSWKTDAVSASTSGAATQTVGGNTKAYEGGSNAYTYVDTTIDASASDPTYQDGATVQPPATQMYLYFYVGNFEQSAVEQTAGLNAELFNNKADRNLLNTTDNVDIVIESQLPTEDNGYTWYRKYKSGWVEQGGQSDNTKQSVIYTVTLPVPMSNENYTATVTSTVTGNGYILRANSRTTTSFQIRIDTFSAGADPVGVKLWYVCGQAA